MKACRVHITGASGSGTSTLARALAATWAVPCHDTDDYFWEPTEPPYTTKRDPTARLALMEQIFVPRRAWVLSGSLVGWGDPLIPYFDFVVFLKLDPAVRLARLRAREGQRYGPEFIETGGAGHAQHMAFMDWAAGYDDETFTGRSLKRHCDWLAHLPCPVLELDSARPVQDLLNSIVTRA